MVYKPTYNWGAPLLSKVIFIFDGGFMLGINELHRALVELK
jgi:hypothetical protein